MRKEYGFYEDTYSGRVSRDVAESVRSDFPDHKVNTECILLPWSRKNGIGDYAGDHQAQLRYAPSAIIVPIRGDFVPVRIANWKGRGDGPTVGVADLSCLIVSPIGELTRKNLSLLKRPSRESVRELVEEQYGIAPGLDDMVSIYRFTLLGGWQRFTKNGVAPVELYPPLRMSKKRRKEYEKRCKFIFG